MKTKLFFIAVILTAFNSCSLNEDISPDDSQIITRYEEVNQGDIITSYDGADFMFDTTFINPMDSIGVFHNKMMNHYGRNIDSIEAKKSCKYIVDLTYNQMIIFCDSANINPDSVMLDNFYNGMCNNLIPHDFPVNPLEQIQDFIYQNNIAISSEFIDDMDFLLSKLYTVSLQSSVDTLQKDIKLIEQKIYYSDQYTEKDKNTLLAYCSTFNHSYTQMRDEFSYPSHPLNNLYFNDSFKSVNAKSTEDLIAIAVADASGVGTGVYTSFAMGPWGWFIFGVGYGAGYSIIEAVRQVGIDLIVDAIENN